MEVVQHDGTNPVLAEAVHVDMPSAITNGDGSGA